VEVEYDDVNFKGDVNKETQSIARFLYDDILYKENYHGYREKIRLEDQPQLVVEAMGRLVERLLDKNILDLNDLKYIAGSNWGRKSDSLTLKKEEAEE
jgi:hypothetical protein